jgi:acetyltransferase
VLADGTGLLLRPILPEDEPALQRAFARLTPAEIRLRFFAPVKRLSHLAAARFTQPDYDREMVLIVTDRGTPGATEIHGVVQISADPDNERAEYAIVVRRELTGRGLGTLLMRRIIEYSRRRGIHVIFGDVLRENTAMLRLCDELGFTRHAVADDPDVVRVELALADPH